MQEPVGLVSTRLSSTNTTASAQSTTTDPFWHVPVSLYVPPAVIVTDTLSSVVDTAAPRASDTAPSAEKVTGGASRYDAAVQAEKSSTRTGRR